MRARERRGRLSRGISMSRLAARVGAAVLRAGFSGAEVSLQGSADARASGDVLSFCGGCALGRLERRGHEQLDVAARDGAAAPVVPFGVEVGDACEPVVGAELA